MAGVQYNYDDSQLQELFAQLDEKQQVKAMKGGFRRAANKFRKAAVGNLRGSGIKSSLDLESGVRALVFKRSLGFRVTVGTTNKKGFHKNRFGQLKPILLWAEDGTTERWTKSNGGKHTRAFCFRQRKRHYTGKMPDYKFMAKTRDAQEATITEDLHNTVRESVAAAAKRCGCKI